MLMRLVLGCKLYGVLAAATIAMPSVQVLVSICFASSHALLLGTACCDMLVVVVMK